MNKVIFLLIVVAAATMSSCSNQEESLRLENLVLRDQNNLLKCKVTNLESENSQLRTEVVYQTQKNEIDRLTLTVKFMKKEQRMVRQQTEELNQVNDMMESIIKQYNTQYHQPKPSRVKIPDVSNQSVNESSPW